MMDVVNGIFESQAAIIQILFESKNKDKKEKMQNLDLVKKENKSKARHDDRKSEAERMPDCFSAANKKKDRENNKTKINRGRFNVFEIFNVLGLGEEDTVNKTKNKDSNKKITMSKAKIYVNAFKGMLEDFQNRDFDDKDKKKQITETKKKDNTANELKKDKMNN